MGAELKMGVVLKHFPEKNQTLLVDEKSRKRRCLWPVQYDLIQYDVIRYDIIRYGAIRCDAIRYNTLPLANLSINTI